MNTHRFVRAQASAAEAVEALHTVRDLIRYAVSRMQAAGVCLGHGTDELFDEAAWLVLWSLHLPLERLEPFLDARLTPTERVAAVTLIERRCTERLPSAYLTGEAWLRGMRFLSDARALVPRSPIAELFDGDALLPWLPDPEAVSNVLDLCTGGASLAVLAAHAYPNAQVIGSDLSPDALALAAENIALHQLTERVQLRQGSLWEPLQDQRFDLIVCNPPYVNSDSMAALPLEYRHEPQQALAGGPDGMDLIRIILEGAASHLNETGIMVLEVGHEAAHFEAAFARLEGIWLPIAAGDDQLVLLERSALARL